MAQELTAVYQRGCTAKKGYRQPLKRLQWLFLLHSKFINHRKLAFPFVLCFLTFKIEQSKINLKYLFL